MATSKTVQVKEFSIRETSIPITGVSPLIVHAWSEKAKREMLEKQMGKAAAKKRDVKDPEQDYEAAKHKSPMGWEGVPVSAFKASMVRAAKLIGMEMKSTQMSFFIHADCEITQLIRIFGESRMRQDMVRTSTGQPDIRFRPEYPNWNAELKIEFNAGMISLEQVFQLVKTAGQWCGICEMRPEKTKFSFGRFKLTNE